MDRNLFLCFLQTIILKLSVFRDNVFHWNSYWRNLANSYFALIMRKMWIVHAFYLYLLFHTYYLKTFHEKRNLLIVQDFFSLWLTIIVFSIITNSAFLFFIKIYFLHLLPSLIQLDFKKNDLALKVGLSIIYLTTFKWLYKCLEMNVMFLNLVVSHCSNEFNLEVLCHFT